MNDLPISFVGPEPQTDSHSCNFSEGEASTRAAESALQVVPGLRDHFLGTLTDEDRETAIQQATEAFERAWMRWEGSGCFAARGDAERFMHLRDDLIRGRSAAQVARMEQERGFA